MSHHEPLRYLGVTLGDPAGVGPEISLKALQEVRHDPAFAGFGFVLIGHRPSLAGTARLLSVELPETVEASASEWPRFAVIDTNDAQDGAVISPGIGSAQSGRQAYEAVCLGARLALSGRIAGIVTAPLNKEALHMADVFYSGHTELLADLCGVAGAVMLLLHGNMRVSHLTTHIALADVPDYLTAERLRRVIDLTRESLIAMGIDQPRIAVAALNPHGGEGGAFGREDIDISAPVIAAYRAQGFDVIGPEPGDTVFIKLKGGVYDAVVAMYHDQGHIPVKLLGFDLDRETGLWTELKGVNTTLGLPIIRTSPDHGTAYDIAGKGVAVAQSQLEAIRVAVALCSGGSVAEATSSEKI